MFHFADIGKRMFFLSLMPGRAEKNHKKSHSKSFEIIKNIEFVNFLRSYYIISFKREFSLRNDHIKRLVFNGCFFFLPLNA